MQATSAPRRPSSRCLLAIALVPLALVLAWVLYSRLVLAGPYEGRYPQPFDREAWLDAAEDPEGARYLMVEDLLDRGLVQGLSMDAAEKLLGPATDTQHFAGAGPCWYLGPEPSFLGIDSAWLLLDVEGDQIVGGRVVTD